MLLEYCAQRLSIDRVVPLAVVIAAASQNAAPSGRSVLLDALLALVLIAQFRVWDDLADRKRDAVTHPGRVTVRATTVTPLAVACAALATCGFAIVVFRGSWSAAIALAGLNVLLALWYSRRGARSLIGDHVVLAKYPIFVLIVVLSRSAVPARPVWLAMLAVFLAVSVYEAVHDRNSPGARRPVLLACEAALLGLVLVACGVRL
jgi:4-hydroxybenzoate polyprenyltransferase